MIIYDEETGMASFEEEHQDNLLWEIGRAQQEMVDLAQSGEIQGSILDIGCGSGENALYLAEIGYSVVGIDCSPTAIARAMLKAHERDLKVTFFVFDALHVAKLGLNFDTVIDSGLFEVYSDKDRLFYVENLYQVLNPGGRYYMLCTSERENEPIGPRKINKRDINSSFGEGWKAIVIRKAKYETNCDKGWCHAWLATIERL
jgi:2-polyprenyl-3-methyl-5-hydroxy-6-metoxy-1,4-benzoquinol methylase